MVAKLFKSPVVQKNPFLRKCVGSAMRLSRMLRRMAAGEDDYLRCPPVICNSFPKSGTHLLVQILEALPNVRDMGTFCASVPSVPFKERTQKVMLRKIERVAPGELVLAHLFHEPDYADSLSRKHAVHYFIYRDLRDVAISEAHYLTHMNRWHRLHRYYARLATDGERIAWAITGEKNPAFPYDYPDIGKRFARYRGWIDNTKVCLVRFEDLIGDDRENQVQRIVSHYLSQVKKQTDTTEEHIDTLTADALDHIDPSRSRTFRSGGAGGWRSAFTDEHRKLMKQSAAELLIELGYERDADW